MFVIAYNVSNGTYQGQRSFVSVYDMEPDENYTDLTAYDYRPFNNSVWMVPGTIDPDQD